MTDITDPPSTGRAVPPQQRRPLAPRSAREVLQPNEVPPPPVRSRAARHPMVVVLNLLMTFIVIAVLAVGGVALYAKIQFDQAGPLEQSRVVEVPNGTGMSAIADMLQDAGIISNRWIFRAGVTLAGSAESFKAGEYEIPARASMHEIMDSMVSGEVVAYSVTIPEGLTSAQIVARLMANEFLTGEITTIPPEGSLLPETYRFSRGETRQNIINRMRRDRDAALIDVWSRRVEGLPISTPEELVILASIVERETGIADERSRVAAVFINRLTRGMRLQSDPTVIYGMFGGEGLPSGRAVFQSDLDNDNPYNTYVIPGLPIGPIANPGRASLEAVANPSRTNDLYFVADGTGGHVFAETLAEHNRNVARWRQLQGQ